MTKCQPHQPEALSAKAALREALSEKARLKESARAAFTARVRALQAEGLQTTAIASRLGVAVSTVRIHLAATGSTASADQRFSRGSDGARKAALSRWRGRKAR